MIKEIYVNGDSWTWGEELAVDKPDTDTYKYYNTWPWHVKTYLDIPILYNDAQGGSSNYRIFRKTIDFIRRHKHPEKLFVIVAWTSPDRTEIPVADDIFYDNGYSKWKEHDIKYVRILKNEKPNTDSLSHKASIIVKKMYKNLVMLDNMHINNLYLDQQQWIMQQICKSLGVKLLQCHAFWPIKSVMQKKHLLPDTFNSMLSSENKCIYGHPNEIGHKIIGQNVYTYIKKNLL